MCIVQKEHMELLKEKIKNTKNFTCFGSADFQFVHAVWRLLAGNTAIDWTTFLQLP